MEKEVIIKQGNEYVYPTEEYPLGIVIRVHKLFEEFAIVTDKEHYWKMDLGELGQLECLSTKTPRHSMALEFDISGETPVLVNTYVA